MKSVYELKRYKNSKHPDLVNALKLYATYTEPAFRTDTKEIMHCLDFWNTDFKDPFFVFGFYLNNILIGFSELAYFVDEKFVIVDYIVIHENYRGNNTFYQFINDIKDFLHQEGLEYNYIVAEVGCYNEGFEPPENSKLLIRLLKMAHFGVVKCNYYVPRVGINDFESQMRAIMMVYSLNESKQIRKETFFQIVNAIYFKYYGRWHNLFVDHGEKKKYEEELKFLVKKMEKNLDKKSTIEINGLSGLFPVNLTPEGDVKSKKLLKILTGIFLFLLCVFVLPLIYRFIQKQANLDIDSANTIITVSVGVAVFGVAMIFENKSNIFSKLLEKVLG